MSKTAICGCNGHLMPTANQQQHLLTKTLLVMKLTFALLTLAFMNLHANTLAQTVSLTGKNISIEQVFSSVEKQSGYVFLYTPGVLKGAKPVTIDADQLPLLQFLELVLKEQPFRYSIRSKTIHLSRKEVPAPEIPSIAKLLEVPVQVKVTGIVSGINNQPLAGATVRNQATKETVVTNNEGRFSISAEKGARLQITYIGYEPYDWKVNGTDIKITLKQLEKKLDDVEVVINTGYRKFKANEMVGAVDVIDEKTLKQQVGTNILQRLDGVTPSLQFLSKSNPTKTSGNPYSKLNIAIRGWNTINGPTDPLIILDDFPYEGDINNIDPNNVASVTILKDAAAASVWGARASNGVIVIETKRGRFNQKPRIEINSTTTVGEKPRLNKLPLLSTPEYIDLEIAIRRDNLPPETDIGTPVTDILVARKLGKISPEDSASRIDYLKTIDSRKEWSKHIYVHPIIQQHSVSITGGSPVMAWNLNVNYRNTRSATRARIDQLNLSFGNTYRLNAKLDIDLNLNYTAAKDQTGAPDFNRITSNKIGYLDKFIPYLQLADESGNPAPMTGRYNQTMLDTLGAGLLLDYNYYPLNDWKQDYIANTRNAYGLTATLNYRPVRDLRISFSVNSQKQNADALENHGKESFYARDIINIYSIINRTNQTITRPVPIGDIRLVKEENMSAFSARGKLYYSKKIGSDHQVVVDANMEVSQTRRKGEGNFTFGYNESPLYHTILDPNYIYPQLPGGFQVNLYKELYMELYSKKTMLETRFISANTTASYILKDRYVFFGGLRRDGANILGVKTNDRWTPFWSTGMNWMINKEKFFKVKWIDQLRLSATLGITGNVDPSRSSEPVGNVFNSNPFPTMNVEVAPNPNLRWEKTTTYNFALGFSILKSRISGELNYFYERGRDLYGDILTDYTQTPGNRMKVNQSAMNTYGWELIINTRNIVGAFNWTTTFNWGRTIDKVVDNLYLLNTSNAYRIFYQDGQSFDNNTFLIPGQALYSVSGIRSAGLNAEGDLQFLVNGKPTTNIQDVYDDIFQNGSKSTSYRYFGSGSPTFNGTVVNQFSWKQFHMLVSMQYEFGYYFRKPTLDGQFHLSGKYHEDWRNRWQQPGDEAFTTVPKYDFSLNGSNNNYFLYRLMDHHVRRGDNIRINNIRLSYDIPLKPARKGFQSLGLAFNASNLGVIWTANKEGVDPRSVEGEDRYMFNNLPERTCSITISAAF